jgi:hypothetical protein
MWWGGFLLGGLLLIFVSVPFFSFPKVLTHEKEKIRLTEKAAAAGSSNGGATAATNQHPPAAITKNDSGYGKDIKGATVGAISFEIFLKNSFLQIFLVQCGVLRVILYI